MTVSPSWCRQTETDNLITWFYKITLWLTVVHLVHKTSWQCCMCVLHLCGDLVLNARHDQSEQIHWRHSAAV